MQMEKSSEKDILIIDGAAHAESYPTDSAAYEEKVKEFPPLRFVHKEMNYTFELTYEDLFIEKYGSLQIESPKHQEIMQQQFVSLMKDKSEL